MTGLKIDKDLVHLHRTHASQLAAEVCGCTWQFSVVIWKKIAQIGRGNSWHLVFFFQTCNKDNRPAEGSGSQ